MKWRGKRQSKNVDPDIYIGPSMAQRHKKEMDDNPNTGLASKVKTKDNPADEISGAINTVNMQRGTGNKITRTETVLQHLIPSDSKLKFKKVNGRKVPYFD